MFNRTIGLILAFLMITGGILYAVSGQSAITDANWESIGGMPGVEGPVYAMTSDGKGNFYAAGYIRTAGGVFVKGIGKWNGSEWSALGSGTSGGISAISIDKSNNLYVGGYFDTAGGILVNNIAKWNGSGWSTLGSGLKWTSTTNSYISKIISDIVTDAFGNVYVAGSFDTAGGVAAKGIAKWDGNTWSSLGSGVNGSSTQPSIRSLAVDRSGNLYAGGEFDSIGGIAANNIAKWDGTAWSSLGTGTDSIVLAVAVDSLGSLYVSGLFTNVNGSPANHIAKWNGTAWSPLGTGVYNIAGSSTGKGCLSIDKLGNVYIAGHLNENDYSVGIAKPNRIVKWNGTEWSILGEDIILSSVLSLHIDVSGTVYAGSRSEISKWDGNTWNKFGSHGTNDLVCDIAVDSSNNIYAGGYFTAIGNNEIAAKGIARWDGHSWNALEDKTVDGNTFIYSDGLTVDKSGIVYAVGNISSSFSTNVIAWWDGKTWNEIGRMSSPQPYVLDRAGNLYAAGIFTTINGKAVNNIARWDGSEWSPLGYGMRCKSEGTYSEGAYIKTLAFDESGNLYASGLFDSAGSVAANNIAKWDGNSWSSLGNGIKYLYDIPVLALAFDKKGNLYAGGYFDTAGTVPAKNIAKWDGNAWSALGCGIDHVADLDGQTGVFALAVDKSDNLYVGGGFYAIGETPANFIARWDGSSWSSLGSGVFGGNLVGMGSSVVFALAIDNTNTLYAGGDFLSAGGKPSAYIAKCNLNTAANKQHRFVRKSSTGFTYVYRSGMIHWTTPLAGALSYRIFTLTGREVYRDAVKLPAGTNSLRLKTGNLSRGLYIGHVVAGKESMQFQMMVE